MTKICLLLPLILCLNSNSWAQDWDIEKEFDGITIFTRLVDGAEIKELKIEFTLNMRLAPIVALINDSDQFNDWVYNSVEFKPLDSKGPGNGYYYGVVDFPWPMDDRDYVIETTTTQDPESKVVMVESKNASLEGNPAIGDYVRIPAHHNQWILTPVGENEVFVKYWLKSDPGGAIPKWLINLAIDKGATQTIKNMKTKLAACEPDMRLSYIEEK